ncbi:hypothetical protein JL720_946 [Aureococcus anophagefferens]|nr:hypothetical protein JL720_946 [Aureococcus anophagefferens]
MEQSCAPGGREVPWLKLVGLGRRFLAQDSFVAGARQAAAAAIRRPRGVDDDEEDQASSSSPAGSSPPDARRTLGERAEAELLRLFARRTFPGARGRTMAEWLAAPPPPRAAAAARGRRRRPRGLRAARGLRRRPYDHRRGDDGVRRRAPEGLGDWEGDSEAGDGGDDGAPPQGLLDAVPPPLLALAVEFAGAVAACRVEAAARRFRDLGRRCRVAADLSYVPGLVLDFEGLERVGRKFRITGAALALRARDVDRLAAAAVAPFLETLHVSRSLLADLKPLAALPRLRTVRVEACRKLQGTLEPLLGCKELREVDLRRAAVTGSLWPLAGLPLLKSLSLLSCWELDGSLYPLHASKNLVHVDLYSCRHVTGTLEHVGALAKLETLKLRECHALGGTLEPLERLARLRHLDLSCCYEMSGTLAPVSKLANLEVLNLHCCYLLRGPRNHVNGLAKLKSLNLLGCSKLTGHAIYPRARGAGGRRALGRHVTAAQFVS